MRLSTIITSYDKHDITKLHARECFNATLLPDELIIVNDGGTPDLREKLIELKKPIKYARIEQDIPWNYTGACNLGVWLSRGDYLAFEDNDNIPHKDFYQQAIDLLEKNLEVGVVFGKIRHDVSASDLEKPVDEWKVIGSRGPNRGSYIIRREIYLRIKGQDEQFSGKYGWMYYNFRRQLLAMTKFSEIGLFYYVVEGQSNLSHKSDPKNYHIYHKNCKSGKLQSPIGILNFTFTYETLFDNNLPLQQG